MSAGQQHRTVREQREAEAAEHTRAMTEKYRGIQFGAAPVNDGKNYKRWFNYTVDGKQTRDSPKPYCRRYYFCFFITCVFPFDVLLPDSKRVGAWGPTVTEAATYIRNTFNPADEIDRFYVEELLLQAEELGLFDSEKVIFVRGNGTYGHGKKSEVRQIEHGDAYTLNGHRISPTEIFEGGPQQRRRAELVRQWFNVPTTLPSTNATAPGAPAELAGNTSKLSIAELALREIYEHRAPITRERAAAIAVENGHHSGEKLYQRCCLYFKASNRTGFDDQCSRQARAMMQRISNLLPVLSEAARQQAERELRTIEAGQGE